jgi:hypothetical protein
MRRVVVPDRQIMSARVCMSFLIFSNSIAYHIIPFLTSIIIIKYCIRKNKGRYSKYLRQRPKTYFQYFTSAGAFCGSGIGMTSPLPLA